MARGQGGQRRPGPRPGPPRGEGPAPGPGRSGPGSGGASRSERGARGARPERPARPERGPRAERPARPERAPRSERPTRPERLTRPERPERASRPERAPRPERPERAERSERAPRPERLERAPRPERPERAARAPREDIVYGRNPVLEAARAGRVRRLHMASGTDPDPRLAELLRLGLPVQPATPDSLERLSEGGVHQGVVAEVKPRHFLTLRQLLDRRPSPDLLVALDSILDPQNLGAILRSAEAAGADAAILPERRSAPLSAAAAKASAGATEHLTLARVSGLAGAVSEVRRAGIWCVALDPHGDLWPWEFDFKQPVCVVVGGEGPGVHRLVRERCDARVRLPMAGRVESLNASAAAAVLLYEVARQRADPSRR